MANYDVPGVYVEEITTFPPSVAPVETALPVFLGHTIRIPAENPSRIGSYLEFTTVFGAGRSLSVTELVLTADGQFVRAAIAQSHYLDTALRLFYANGGGDCYVYATGTADADGKLSAPTANEVTDALPEIAKITEPTLVVIPDHVGEYSVYDAVIQHCEELKDRFGVLSVAGDDPEGDTLRNGTGNVGLSYAAAYTPWLHAALPKTFDVSDFAAADVTVGDAAQVQGLSTILTDTDVDLNDVVGAADLEDRLAAEQNLRASSTIYRNIVRGIQAMTVPVPPDGAVAGLYARVDRNRGVWKAPANVSISGILGPVTRFTQSQLADLNVDPGGKSINAIRFFTGKGTLVYGARTLDGNDGEYKYVSVRRLLIMIEESVARATEAFVFEPNDANTWVRVRGMIENFLNLLWRDGALQGGVPEHAYQVAVGLGQTMTAVDVLEGRMIVQIRLAPVRPAEFIVLQFMQHLPTS